LIKVFGLKALQVARQAQVFYLPGNRWEDCRRKDRAACYLTGDTPQSCYSALFYPGAPHANPRHPGKIPPRENNYDFPDILDILN
jgi:hypothetical protein